MPLDEEAGPEARNAAPVLAVTGLGREARIAAGAGVMALGAGGSPDRLRALLAERAPACSAVVSFGIAGGLDPALPPGAVVVATAIVTTDGRRATHTEAARCWAERLSRAGERIVAAEIAGVEVPLLGIADKRALRAATGAVAVDMESHVAADFAVARGLPFAALRVVCDPADRALPALAGQALRPDGGIDLAAILRHLLHEPAQLAVLPRLARDAATAFAALGRVRASLGPRLGLGGLGLGEPFRHVP